ncbi:SprT family protein [Vagococcus acidifermentans]|uniref:SprT family protein n=1 Tax=Vagococcus acidifermentans TaxID=564710 RepID=A0A430APW0_9ENTE|nr:SprT family protein [Vagococcus acidifermentans]
MNSYLNQLSEELSDDTLQQLVEDVSLTFFNKPFKHRAVFNSRLRTTGGRYHLNTHNLDFNPKVYQKYGDEELINVIKHELCHYHLHLDGQGYRHRDIDFKLLLKQTGGSRFVKPLSDYKPEDYHQYVCLKCETLFLRKRRINVKKYRCRCGGALKEKETAI